MSSAGSTRDPGPYLGGPDRGTFETPPGGEPTCSSVAPRPSLRRLADGFALLCVAGATLAISLAAAPSIARELGWTRASLSHRPHAHPPTGNAPLRNDPILVDPDVFEPGALRNPSYAVDDNPEFERAAPAKFAVAVRDVVVRTASDDRSKPIAQVPRGELLLVIRQEGEWALVAHIADDGGKTGWVRSGDLAIR